MYITLYFIVTRLPDSLSAAKDLLLALDPTDLTIDLLEKHLLAAETSILAVGASRGTPRTPFFEGCSPSPLVPSVASTTAVDSLRAEEVGAASAPSGRRRSGSGRGGRGSGGGRGGGGGGGGGGGDRSSETCGKLHTQYRCFSRLTDTFLTEFPDAAKLPRWAELLRQGVDIFALDYDAILTAMYALTVSVESDSCLCMPPDPGIEAAALGASESAALGGG
ncbi:unnamed protein product [Closterium sp. NIES-65]|nr:unnamed protein product [Closterium sp. NIES-65]